MHDDQHGTAIVVLAALKGAVKLTQKKNVKLLLPAPALQAMRSPSSFICKKYRKGFHWRYKSCDSKGVVSIDRSDLDEYKKELAQLTKQTKTMVTIQRYENADVFMEFQ